MRDSSTLLVGLGAGASVITAYKLWQRYASPQFPLPPSPKYYPLIGNLLSMPQNNEHLGFIELGKQLNSGSQRINTLRV
jgi:hypothetical protein